MVIESVLEIVIYSVPVYSSITGALLMILTYQDSISKSESRLKFLLIFYYISASFIWLGTIAYHYSHSLFIYMNSFFYLSLLLASVILYHFIFYLTATKKDDRFSKWHYFPPIMIFLSIFVWSLFIPYETQHTIVSGNDAIVPEYKYYSLFYMSKHFLRIIYLAIYTFLCIRRLYFYSKILISRNKVTYKKYVYWLWYIMALSITLIIFSIITALSPYTHIHKFLSNIFTVVLIASAHAVMAYNIISRNYYLIFTEKKASSKQINKSPQAQIVLEEKSKEAPPRKQYSRYQKDLNEKRASAGEKLTKKQFELYFKEQKPYLNPNFKITDLIEPFEVNRTYISRFINKEYGMNFNRYVNRCRLQRFEILTGLTANKGKSVLELIKLAGFGSYRSYMRAKLMEEELNNTKGKK